MFKQKEEKVEEIKNKDAGFVDDKGDAISPEAAKAEKENNTEPNPNDVNLKASFTYDDSHLENIEKKRQEFLKNVKKQNIIKWIVAFVSIGLLVFAWLYFFGNTKFNNNPGMKYGFGFGLTAVAIGMIVAYYIVVKRFNDSKMEIYLKEYYGSMNSYVFGNERFKEVNGDIAGKIANDDFNRAELYKEVSTIGSRNVVKFKVDGKYFGTICDCAAQKSTTRKLEPLFIGKFIIADNTYKGNEPIFVYLPGNSRALPPNNLDQLPKVVNTRKLIIYSNNKNYESVLTSKTRNLITKLITNNILVDVSIAVQRGKTYIGLGYDDCLMVLPLQEKFNPIPIHRFKDDMQIIADIIESLNK